MPHSRQDWLLKFVRSLDSRTWRFVMEFDGPRIVYLRFWRRISN